MIRVQHAETRTIQIKLRYISNNSNNITNYIETILRTMCRWNYNNTAAKLRHEGKT